MLECRTPMKSSVAALLASLFLSSAPAHSAVFGADNRVNVPPASPVYETSRSVALGLLASLQEPAGEGRIKLTPDSLKGYLCPDERFAGEPSMSYACTGFLVGPDLLVTAGHCAVNTGETRDEKEMYCSAYQWLFDYRAQADGTVNVDDVPADAHYKCKRIVYAVKDEAAPFRDYALIQLDREVKGRRPLPLSTGPLNGSGVYQMLGHPHGLPMKHSRHAWLLKNDPARQSFLTSLDAFEGNSGSPVLNEKGEVVGILVGGTPSQGLVTRPGESCQRYNRCAENGTSCFVPDKDTSVFPGYQGVGSEVQRIAPVRALLEELEKR